MSVSELKRESRRESVEVADSGGVKKRVDDEGGGEWSEKSFGWWGRTRSPSDPDGGSRGRKYHEDGDPIVML